MTSQSDLEGNTIEARSETNRRQARWWDGSTYEMAQGWSWITIIIKLNFKQNITLYYDDHKAKDTTMIITAVYEVKYCIRASCFFWKNMTTDQTNQRCLILNLGELIPLRQSQMGEQPVAFATRHWSLRVSLLLREHPTLRRFKSVLAKTFLEGVDSL